MRQTQIFISYRRDDAAGYARAIHAELARHFGAERVFMDVDDIGAGQAFDDEIRRAVGEAKVLLVMIGKRWRGEREGQPARIEDADDFVRLEVAAGLAGGLRVIPLLLDGATMPSEAQLPESLRPLTRRNALEIGNTRFRADIDRLVATLREALGEPVSTRRKATPWWGVAGAALLVGALVAAWQWRAPPGAGSSSAQGQRASSEPVSAPGTTRLAVNGDWQAEVNYDWPNAHFVERFVFAGSAAELQGSASFLRVPRGIVEGRVEPDGISFVTRTSETGGDATRELVHRYRGRLVDGDIHFVMQTEGGSSAHVPVEFIARRTAPLAPAAGSSR